jgi:hypothetical protein
MTVHFPLPIIYASYFILLLGKEEGEKMVLLDFLPLHLAIVRNEYMALSHDEKKALIRDHLRAKEVEVNVPKRVSNVSLTKSVYSKMQMVTATVSVHCTFLMHF